MNSPTLLEVDLTFPFFEGGWVATHLVKSKC